MNRIRLTNSTDLTNAQRGLIPPEQVRTETVEALVDTGAMMLALPSDLVERLGLPVRDTRTAKLADGTIIEVPCVGDILIEILGRQQNCGAIVLPTGTTPLIGQLQLEELNLIVDAKNQEVRVDPAHPDTQIIDLLRVA
jgi:clan AA aspartic protease